MSDEDKKEWTKFILGLAITIVTIGIAWGTLQTKVVVNTDRIDKMEVNFTTLQPLIIENKILLHQALDELREIKVELKNRNK